MLDIEKKSKILKCLIIIITIICLICLSLLIVINRKGKNVSKDVKKNEIQSTNQIAEENVVTEQEEKDNSKILKYTDNRTNYFTVRTLVQNYIDASAYRSAKQVMGVLSNTYINEYKITEENVFYNTDIKQISNSKVYLTYSTEEIIESEQDNYIVAYLVSSQYKMSNSSEYTSTKTLVILDKHKGKYEIYPYQYINNNNLNKLKAGDKLDLKISSISEDAQKFSYQEKTDKDLVNELFDSWQNFILFDKEKAYNKLNSEFKNKKYNSLQSFQSYLNNLGYIPRINEYRTYSTKDYTDYICTDQYNNYYIFRQQGGIMRYTVFLDNYTVELDTFKQNYEKADEETKIIINLGKFKQMLNTKDYNAIYNKLNATFKQNNYNNVSKLAQYLKNNAYAVNTITLDNYNQNNDYYVCECSLINQKNTNEQKNMTIIIKLIDSNNFEMSFNIQ